MGYMHSARIAHILVVVGQVGALKFYFDVFGLYFRINDGWVLGYEVLSFNFYNVILSSLHGLLEWFMLIFEPISRVYCDYVEFIEVSLAY